MDEDERARIERLDGYRRWCRQYCKDNRAANDKECAVSCATLLKRLDDACRRTTGKPGW